MTPDSEKRFHDMADLSDEERERYARQHQLGPDTLREVQSLLDHDGSFELDGAVRNVAQRAVGAPEMQCGAYELKEMIGSGGMGVVYRAERTDGEIRHQAAIKMLRPMFDEAAFRDRFLRERQILAQVSHPNVARLLDAGHTANGVPYLVMEYVKGTRIDEHCASLSLGDRLRLFLKVCDAVAFLHQNLIVHRDLKPGNLLVTDEGEPKLLDFGIAKILDIAAERTLTRDQAWTPEYASPEQIRGAAMTTATDVYSLGAVLYRLLTGQLPRENATSAIIPPSHWNKELRGDLEAVLMVALRDEPGERYSSVEKLAGDIAAYLDFRPVAARRGTLLYRSRKFLRRYWAPSLAAALTGTALVAGVLFVQRERAIAERRFQQVRQLAKRLYEVDSKIAKVPGSVEARRSIVNTALQYLEGLSKESSGDPDLLTELAEIYSTTGKVQFSRVEPSLGEEKQAAESYRKAAALLARASAVRPPDRDAMRLLAKIEIHRLPMDTGADTDHGVSRARAVVKHAGKLLDASASSEDYRIASVAYTSLAHALLDNSELSEAEQTMVLAVKNARRLAESNGAPRAWVELAVSLRVQADVFRYAGELEKGLASLDEAIRLLAVRQHEVPEAIQELAHAHYAKGLMLGDTSGPSLGRYEDALEPLSRSKAFSRDRFLKDSSDLVARLDFAQSSLKMGRILQRTKPAEAISVYDAGLDAIARMPATSARRTTYLVRLLCESTEPLRKLRRHAEAAQRLAKAVSLLRDSKRYPIRGITPGGPGEALLRVQAEGEVQAGRLPRAIALYEESLGMMNSESVRKDQDLGDAVGYTAIQQRLRDLHHQAGNASQAGRLQADMLALWRRWNQRLPGNPLVGRELSRLAQK
ncbi:MAG: serine/threonine protein kinase [Bryobacterales bacterium]|nr:serine/threonine protein kinase [Bryobacterales bacterium]